MSDGNASAHTFSDRRPFAASGRRLSDNGETDITAQCPSDPAFSGAYGGTRRFCGTGRRHTPNREAILRSPIWRIGLVEERNLYSRRERWRVENHCPWTDQQKVASVLRNSVNSGNEVHQTTGRLTGGDGACSIEKAKFIASAGGAVSGRNPVSAAEKA